MHPSYSDIVYFIEAAQALNLSRASERLGITQPSLSASIKRLEGILNTTLFVRNKNGVQLTKPGSLFLQRAQDLKQAWENVASDIHAESQEASGIYKIGAHNSVALHHLPGVITSLVTKNPKLQIRMTHDLSRIICERVVSFDVDFGVVVNPIPHPDLVVHELLKDEVSFWTSSKVKDTGVIICEPNLLQSQELLLKMKTKKTPFIRMITTSSLEMVAKLIDEGCGVGILPGKVVKANPHLKLKLLGGNYPVVQDRICLVYRADIPKTMAAKEIIAAIKNANT